MSNPQDHPLFEPIVKAISRWHRTPPAEPTYGDLAAEIVELMKPFWMRLLPHRVDAFCQRHPDVAVDLEAEYHRDGGRMTYLCTLVPDYPLPNTGGEGKSLDAAFEKAVAEYDRKHSLGPGIQPPPAEGAVSEARPVQLDTPAPAEQPKADLLEEVERCLKAHPETRLELAWSAQGAELKVVNGDMYGLQTVCGPTAIVVGPAAAPLFRDLVASIARHEGETAAKDRFWKEWANEYQRPAGFTTADVLATAQRRYGVKLTAEEVKWALCRRPDVVALENGDWYLLPCRKADL